MTSERRTSLLVPTLVFVGLLVAIVSSLGAPLIPTIAQTYRVPLSTAQWVLTATLLTGALATPVLGKLADGPRQRAVILSILAVVLVGCVLSAVATSFVVLVLGRALQGVGLGLLPVNMAIARRNLDRERAGRAIATLSVSTAIGAGLGYPITAVVAQVLGLHAAYWFGALMVVAALATAAVVLPPPSTAVRAPFDVARGGAAQPGRDGRVGGAQRGGLVGLDLAPQRRTRGGEPGRGGAVGALRAAGVPPPGQPPSPGQPRPCSWPTSPGSS